MTQIADIDGHNAYSAEIPDHVEYVIFDNGTVQTDKIAFFDGKSHTYRAVDQVNEKGRYLYTID